MVNDEPEAQTEPATLHGTIFRGRDLRTARFVGCDLGSVVVRGSDIAGMELDSPWLLEGDSQLLVNGVDVVPLVDTELNRRFPGRALRTASGPAGLQAAWAAVEEAWAATVARAAAMPDEVVDASVDGEWSLSQTLCHLVFATDLWLGKAILGREEPAHPIGLEYDDTSDDAHAAAGSAPFADVLTVRAERQRMVRDYLADVTAPVLAEARPSPHDPEYGETVLSCLRTILEEEWEHHRYVVRDLETLASAR